MEKRQTHSVWPLCFDTAVLVAVEDALDVSDGLLRGLYAYGFEKPTALQRRCLPAMLAKRDCVVVAQPDTGKTAAACLCALQHAQPQAGCVQAVFVTATRSLATNTERMLAALGEYLQVEVLSRGTSITDSLRRLRGGGVQVRGEERVEIFASLTCN